VTLINWLGLVVLSMIWGSSFLFVELAVDHVAPITIVFFRVGLAALALILYCLFKRLRIPLEGKHIRQYVIMGFLAHALPFALITWGQTHITAGLASIYNATTPLFTVLVAHYLLADERANKTKFIGVLTGLAGVAVLIGGNLKGLSFQNILGQMAGLCAAISYAFSVVYGRKFSGVKPAGIAAATLTGATLLIAPLAFIPGSSVTTLPPASAVAAIVALALLCTAIAYIIYYWILEHAGATNLSLVTFLIPASAIMLGIVFLGETLALNHIAGLALIFCGLILVDGQVLRFMSRLRSSRI
jgi:drug/metabolite transporter (DMT)-like permease